VTRNAFWKGVSWRNSAGEIGSRGTDCRELKAIMMPKKLTGKGVWDLDTYTLLNYPLTPQNPA
jgi:hypothetical protein